MPILVWIVLLNGISMVCCVALFQRKGRSALGGAALGLLLGLFGILIAACLGDAVESAEPRRSFRLSR